MSMNRLGRFARKVFTAAIGLCFSLATSAVTINFDDLAVASGSPASGNAVTNYLAQYGITLSGMLPGQTAQIANVSQVQWMWTSSSPNALMVGGINPIDTFTLTFSSPVSNFSFVRIGNVARYSPSGTVKGSWSAMAYNASGAELGQVGEDLISTYDDLPSKTFTLAYAGIASIAFTGNSYNWAGTNLPTLDDFSYTTSAAAAAGCTTATVSNLDVFTWAEARFPGLFGGTPVRSQLGQYAFTYYPSTGNYLVIDSSCMLYALGPITNNAPIPITTVKVLADAVTAWKAANAGGGGGGGNGGGGDGGGGADPPACTYSVTPASLTFGPEGGTGTVEVRQNESTCTVPNPPWNVASGSAWIVNVRAGALSNGQGPAYFDVLPNDAAAVRNGAVQVAGTNIAVTQTGQSANPLEGHYNGSWSGSCTLFGAVSGTLTMDIDAQGTVHGTYGGDDDGVFSGAVNASGGMDTASGVASGGEHSYWSGTIAIGGFGSSGQWQTAGCSGGWTIP